MKNYTKKALRAREITRESN